MITDYIARRRWPFPLIITAAAVFAYANSLHVPLHLDDTSAITNNPSIQRLWPPWQPLLPPAHVTTGGRPLANLSFAFNYAVGGTNVFGYHLANLAIHVLAALALFGIVQRTLSDPLGPTTARTDSARKATVIAGAVALIWAVHPLTTATITYLSQRTEALMALCYLLTLYAFIRSCTAPRPAAWQILSVASCAAGMASKESMVTAPLLVLLYDRVFVSGTLLAAWRARRHYYLGLAGTWLLLALLLTTGLAQRKVGFGLGVSAGRYLLTECEAIVTYLRLAFWPWPLVFDYGPMMQPGLAAAAPYVFVVVGLLAATVLVLRRAPRAGFLCAAFLLLLAPTSTFVPVAMQPIAENRAYLPLATAITLALCGLHALAGTRATSCLAVGAVALGLAAHARNTVFQSPLALWRDAIGHRPANPRAYDNYASALAEAGRLPEAIAMFERALALNPASGNTRAMLAGTCARAGRLDEAERHYVRALELNPQLHEVRLSYGMFLYHAGRPADALRQLEAVLGTPAENVAAHHYLALAHAHAGQMQRAALHFEQALRAKPDEPVIHCSYAALLAAADRPAAALEHYRAAIRLSPRLREAQLGAAAAAIALGRYDDAVTHAESAVQLHAAAPDAHYYAGVALAGLGRNADAAAKFKHALRLDPNHAAARSALAQLGAAPR